MASERGRPPNPTIYYHHYCNPLKKFYIVLFLKFEHNIIFRLTEILCYPIGRKNTFKIVCKVVDFSTFLKVYFSCERFPRVLASSRSRFLATSFSRMLVNLHNNWWSVSAYLLRYICGHTHTHTFKKMA